MAKTNQEWESLGRDVQDIIDQAINSHDYQKLNQSIRQVVNRAVDLGSEAVRKAVDGVGSSTSQQSEIVVEKKNLPALYGSTGGQKTKGILKIVGGGVLSFGTFVTMLMQSIFGSVPVVSLAGFAGGVWLVCSGVNTVGRVGRFKAYRKALGQKTQVTLEKLARTVGKNVKFVRKEVQQMIRDGLFIEGHLDNEQTMLITSDETYRNFEQSRLALEQRRKQEAAEQVKKAASAHTPQVQEVLDKGNAFIAEIRRCNDIIPGEAVSAKIDRMELIVRRIFERAETNPEIVPDLKKMMDYYLPMTVKLLPSPARKTTCITQSEASWRRTIS